MALVLGELGARPRKREVPPPACEQTQSPPILWHFGRFRVWWSHTQLRARPHFVGSWLLWSLASHHLYGCGYRKRAAGQRRAGDYFPTPYGRLAQAFSRTCEVGHAYSGLPWCLCGECARCIRQAGCAGSGSRRVTVGHPLDLGGVALVLPLQLRHPALRLGLHLRAWRRGGGHKMVARRLRARRLPVRPTRPSMLRGRHYFSLKAVTLGGRAVHVQSQFALKTRSWCSARQPTQPPRRALRGRCRCAHPTENRPRRRHQRNPG